jgi:hypothetical protein
MTYGPMPFANHEQNRIEEAVSHSAELVRGDFAFDLKAPSSALRAPSPQGEKGRRSVRGLKSGLGS